MSLVTRAALFAASAAATALWACGREEEAIPEKNKGGGGSRTPPREPVRFSDDSVVVSPPPGGVGATQEIPDSEAIETVYYCHEAPANQGTDRLFAYGNFSEYEISLPPNQPNGSDCNVSVYVDAEVNRTDFSRLANYVAKQDRLCRQSVLDFFQLPSQPCHPVHIFVVPLGSPLLPRLESAARVFESGQMVYTDFGILYDEQLSPDHTVCVEPFFRHEITHSLLYPVTMPLFFPPLLNEGLPEEAHFRGDATLKAEVRSSWTVDLEDLARRTLDYDICAENWGRDSACGSAQNPQECCFLTTIGPHILDIEEDGARAWMNLLYTGGDELNVFTHIDGVASTSVGVQNLKIQNESSLAGSDCNTIGHERTEILSFRGAQLCFFAPNQLLLTRPITKRQGEYLCKEDGFVTGEALTIASPEDPDNELTHFSWRETDRFDYVEEEDVWSFQTYASTYCAWEELVEQHGEEALQKVMQRLVRETAVPPHHSGYRINFFQILNEELGITEEEARDWLAKYNQDVDSFESIFFRPFCSEDHPAAPGQEVHVFEAEPALPEIEE